ncbi:MAG: response regulator [Candidatus Omnitrophica bacterium]|nr:response regulator [Candidatus Omnitrophota bacterium]
MEAARPRRVVLMIDDEASGRKITKLLLERSGYHVLTAPGGEEGLVLAKAEHPDVILLDIMMPKMDGYETLRCLKRDPDTKIIPVLMLTAKGSDQDIAMSFKLGAVFHLDKPFETKDLLRRIEGALALAAQEDGGAGGPTGPNSTG